MVGLPSVLVSLCFTVDDDFFLIIGTQIGPTKRNVRLQILKLHALVGQFLPENICTDKIRVIGLIAPLGTAKQGTLGAFIFPFSWDLSRFLLI